MKKKDVLHPDPDVKKIQKENKAHDEKSGCCGGGRCGRIEEEIKETEGGCCGGSCNG